MSQESSMLIAILYRLTWLSCFERERNDFSIKKCSSRMKNANQSIELFIGEMMDLLKIEYLIRFHAGSTESIIVTVSIKIKICYWFHAHDRLYDVVHKRNLNILFQLPFHLLFTVDMLCHLKKDESRESHSVDTILCIIHAAQNSKSWKNCLTLPCWNIKNVKCLLLFWVSLSSCFSFFMQIFSVRYSHLIHL